MKRLLPAAFVLGFLGVQGHGFGKNSVRKTLSFTPELLDNRFTTESAYARSLAKSGANIDPYDTARDFVGAATSLLSSRNVFVIRNDSYTDSVTGITHVYVRQSIDGLDIVNGGIQLSVKDGIILAVSDKVYRGGVDHRPQDIDVHRSYCAHLRAAAAVSYEQHPATGILDDRTSQVVLGQQNRISFETIDRLNWLDANCAYLKVSEREFTNASPNLPFPHNMNRALARFLVHTLPELYADGLWSRHADGFHVHVAEDTKLIEIDNVLGTVEPVEVQEAFMQAAHDGTNALVHVWKFVVRTHDNWYEATVQYDAPHRIVSIADWVADSPTHVLGLAVRELESANMLHHVPASYLVLPWGINDPALGRRTLEKAHVDALASPFGWHTLVSEYGYTDTSTTLGNNVFAQENWAADSEWSYHYRPDSGAGLVFDYEYSPEVAKDGREAAKRYINASVTQLFYTTNMVHDLYYRYGFDEVSGNFQENNFNRGGEEGDAIAIYAQHGAGLNNADFATPPDGKRPQCRMYMWNTANPYRDGAFDAGVVIHELSHGLSTRLTGGPADSSCLSSGESAGMGEGWGDFFATLIRSHAEYSDYTMGSWVGNREEGIRRYPYSTNMSVNPYTYKSLDGILDWEPHAIGEVWAEVLFVVAQKLIKKHGFSSTLFPPNDDIPEDDFYYPAQHTADRAGKPLARVRVPKHGNTLALQLVIVGLKLQPCMPSFLDARDAIIAADDVLTGGVNYCTLWEGFAERGLGVYALVLGRRPWGGGIRFDDFSVPAACRSG